MTALTLAACAGLVACASLGAGSGGTDVSASEQGVSLESSDFGSWETQQAGGISLVTPGQSLPKSSTPEHLKGTLDTNPSGCVSIARSDGSKVLLLAPFGSTLAQDGTITIHDKKWQNGDAVDVQGSDAPVDEITLPSACHEPSAAFFADRVHAVE